MTAPLETERSKANVNEKMIAWMEREGHGVRGPLERRWAEDRAGRGVVEGGHVHTCIYFATPGLPSVAVAIIPEWADRVAPVYRERMFRDIWRQYERYRAHELRGEPLHQPGDEDDFEA